MSKVAAARRKPRFKLPPGACDTHCHVFGPAAKFPFAASRNYTPEDCPKEELFALHAHLGIERAVIVQATCHGTDNRAVIDAIAVDPSRYRGVAMLDDSVTDAELQQLHRGGIRGVRFTFMRHLGRMADMGTLHRVVDRIKGLGWHVVLYFDAQGIVENADMMKKLPLPFIIDHMGRVDAKQGLDQPAFKVLLELIRRDNCWIKVTGSERLTLPPYTAALPFARALVAAGDGRVLWGTDFPHPNATHEADEADLVDLVPQFAPSAADQQRLLVDNPARLYNFA